MELVTELAYKALNSSIRTLDIHKHIISVVRIADVEGLENAFLEEGLDTTGKPYAVVCIAPNGASAYLEASEDTASDTLTEMEYHIVEASFL